MGGERNNKKTFDNVNTAVKTEHGNSEEFKVKVH